MRVIKEVKQEYEHKCSYCKSIYAYTYEDVDTLWYNQMRCPVCKSINSASIFDKKVKTNE